MSLVNTKHPAFITVGSKKPPCYIHKPPPSKKEEFSIYFYMFPHLAVIWISGYVVAHTMVCTDPLHLSSTLLLQMSSSVCGGGRFCTFHQATNTCGSTDAVFRVGWWDNLRRLPGKQKTPSFIVSPHLSWLKTNVVKKKSLPTAIQWVQRLFMAAGAHLGFHLTGVDPALLSIPRLTCPPPSSFTPAENLKLLQAGDVWIFGLATAI